MVSYFEMGSNEVRSTYCKQVGLSYAKFSLIISTFRMTFAPLTFSFCVI